MSRARPARPRRRAPRPPAGATRPPATRSELEDRVYDLLSAAGLTPPDVNVPLHLDGRRVIPDFRWPEHHLIVEADSNGTNPQASASPRRHSGAHANCVTAQTVRRRRRIYNAGPGTGPRAASSASPIASTTSSVPAGPTSSMPTGSPSPVRPAGTDSAGSPAPLAGSVLRT